MSEVEKKKKKEPTIIADGKEFPVKPGFMDYAKEAFEPTATRAQIDVIRKRRQGS